jgi:hypothetical protein
MLTQSTIFSIIIFCYQVVIIKYNHKSHINKVIYHFYKMTASNNHHPYLTVSRRFKSMLPCTVTTWHHDTREPYRHNEWPQFTMTIKELSQAHRTLVQVFHVIPRRASVGGPHTIPMLSVKYSGVLPNSAIVKATKFAGPHKSHMHQYIINLVHRGQTIGPQST